MLNDLVDVPLAIAQLSLHDSDLAVLEEIGRVSLGSHDRSSLRADLIMPFTFAWGARLGAAGEPVGFIVTWRVADELHVLDVASSPSFRRRGAGRALMLHAIGFAQTSHARLVLLEVRRRNIPAVRLYRALGFTVARVRRAYYDDGEDALEMNLMLDPNTGDIVPSVDEFPVDEEN